MSTGSDLQGHERFRSRPHFRGLDGVRCLAIVSVLWHHSLGQDPFESPLWGRGYLGVDLFFVLSGFLITTILVRQRRHRGAIDLKRFYWRRSLRIFPLYYAFLGALAIRYALADAAEFEQYLEVLPVYALYLTNWVEIEGLNPFQRGWSLAVEEQFYLVWPFLLVVGGVRLGLLATVVVTVLTFALGADSVETVHESGRSLIPFRTILLGSSLAIVLDSKAGYQFAQRLLGGRQAAFATLVALACVFTFYPGAVTSSFELGLHLLMVALVAAVVLRDESPIHSVFEWRAFRFIGLVSYGIYVLHGQFYGAARGAVQAVGGAAWADSRVAFFFALLALSVAAAALTFYFFERPFLKLKDQPISWRSLGVIFRR